MRRMWEWSESSNRNTRRQADDGRGENGTGEEDQEQCQSRDRVVEERGSTAGPSRPSISGPVGGPRRMSGEDASGLEQTTEANLAEVGEELPLSKTGGSHVGYMSVI